MEKSTEQIKEKATKAMNNINPNQEEGTMTKKIEDQTSKIPSSFFLTAAIGSIATSAILKISGRDKDAQFVGQWVAPFLLLGVYNKIVKTLGND